MQQPLFELSKTMVLFSHMNLRQEKHGEESVLAVDLKMSVKTTNDALAMFHPALKARLFKRPDAMTADLVSQAGADELVAYCFPQLETIKWAHEQYNNVVTFPYGFDGKNDIVLDDAKAYAAGRAAAGKDAEIGRLVREKLVSGNCIPVDRCMITAAEVKTIDLARQLPAPPDSESESGSVR